MHGKGTSRQTFDSMVKSLKLVEKCSVFTVINPLMCTKIYFRNQAVTKCSYQAQPARITSMKTYFVLAYDIRLFIVCKQTTMLDIIMDSFSFLSSCKQNGTEALAPFRRGEFDVVNISESTQQ